MQSLPDPDLDQLLYACLLETHPALLEVIQELLTHQISAEQIGRQVERKAGTSSVLPGLCEASARYLQQQRN